MIGKTLAHYRVVEKIGAGGMGEVYRATDSRLGRDVALKVLPAAVAADPERLARFEHEARTVASLNHPNIVVIHAIEDEGDKRFLTMELVEGQGLETLVTPGGLAIERVIELGIGIASALAAAHEKGVVHRDLKPANVMLTRDGRVKVLDFGLAKLASAESVPDSSPGELLDETIATPLSSEGQVVGTVPCMAPEQVRGETVDARTDLFALGILLYELSCGQRPFQGSTPLLGREELLEDASARLRNGARLLSLTGYGGTGKTRFSIELFHRLAPDYAGGAAFISLASVTDPAEVLPVVATALSIPEAHDRSALDALCTVIGDRPVLLVLDNFEQVLGAAGGVAALLSRCPALHCIATRRAPLKIGAEAEFSLPPLDFPEADVTSPEILRRFPAVELFVQRAGKVQPGFAITDVNAAARTRILDPSALLQRLDHALDLLTSGDRDLPIRQRTLRATISWSYSLLDSSEQLLLRRLSTFHEGWTLEALEQVCYGDDGRHRALDELGSLVEKGLVRVLDAGERYSLLETIRAFSAEQLHASGDVEATRSAHADWFLRFAERVAKDLRTTAQLDAMRRGHADNANMHAALRWSISSAQAGDEAALENGLLLSGCLDWFWHISGQHLTARGALDTLLALAKGRPPSRARALARLAAGMVSSVTGEWERSLGESRGGLEDGDAVGDREAAAEGAMCVGYCNLGLGRMPEAGAALDDAIARSTGVSDFLLALSMSLKGMQQFATGHLDAGVALVEEARRIQVRIGDHEGGGVAQSFLAQMTFAKGDATRALALGSFRRAVSTYEQVGSPRGTGLALLGIAAVEAAEGRPERAVAIAAAAEALSTRAGVVVDHPMDPTVVERIEALKATIPQGELRGLLEKANVLTPAAVLAMLAE